jgi:hypothetical protein
MGGIDKGVDFGRFTLIDEMEKVADDGREFKRARLNK